MSNETAITSAIIDSEILTYSFWMSIKDKLQNTGYIQISTWFSPYSVTQRTHLISGLSHPKLLALLGKSQPNENEFLNVLKELSLISITKDVISKITPQIGTVIVSWMLFSNKQRYVGAIRNELAKWVSSNYDMLYIKQVITDYRE